MGTGGALLTQLVDEAFIDIRCSNDSTLSGVTTVTGNARHTM